MSEVEAGEFFDIRTDLVKPELVDRYAGELGIKFDPDTKLEERVQILARKIESSNDTAHLVDCLNCGGVGCEEWPECPFCGDAEEVAAKEGDAAPAEQEDEDVQDEQDEEEPAAAGVSEEMQEMVDRTKAKKSKKKAVGKGKKGSAAKPAATRGAGKLRPPASAPASGLVVPAPSSVVASSTRRAATVQTTGETLAPVGTEALLNKKVQEVQELRVRAVDSMWQLGRKLLEIYSDHLFLTRTTAEGKPAYKTWKQFVDAECGFTANWAYKLMDISTHFTAEDVKTVGVSKLSLMVQLPDEARTELLEKVRSEPTPFDRVVEEVRRLAGGTVRDTGRNRSHSPKLREAVKKAAANRAEKRAGAAPGPKKITVLAEIGRVKLPLMCGAAKRKDVQANSIEDQPVASEDVVNGVRITYRVVSGAKGLFLVIERLRA